MSMSAQKVTELHATADDLVAMVNHISDGGGAVYHSEIYFTPQTGEIRGRAFYRSPGGKEVSLYLEHWKLMQVPEDEIPLVLASMALREGDRNSTSAVESFNIARHWLEHRLKGGSRG